MELEVRAVAQLLQAIFLELGIIVVVDHIDRDDGVASIEQSLGGVKTNEAGGAGHHDASRHDCVLFHRGGDPAGIRRLVYVSLAAEPRASVLRSWSTIIAANSGSLT